MIGSTISLKLETPTIPEAHEKIITKADFREWCKASKWKDQLPALLDAAEYFFQQNKYWHALKSKSGEMIWGVFSAQIEMHYDDNNGCLGWVSPRGYFLPCGWAHHSGIIATLFGMDERDLEDSWVKVSRTAEYTFLALPMTPATPAQEKTIALLEVKFQDIA